MTHTDTLLPCPFCGGKAAMHGAVYMTHKFPACTVCRAEHGDVAHWNRRAIPPDMVLVQREPDDVTLACMKAAINDLNDGASVHVRHIRAAYEWLVKDAQKRAAMKEPKAT